jgi:hypothetical protein
MNKQRIIAEAGESINQAMVSIMRIPDGSNITDVYRKLMDSSQVELLDLALYCESEMIKTSQSGANFSSCLMGAAMNEAFLALMCILFEQDVKATRQYHHSTKKSKNTPYRDVISHWSFDNFIRVSEECNWIPSNIVDREIVTALAEGFRELMPMTHPELSEAEIERGAAAFFDAPGSSMMRMSQSLRNTIHAVNWMRRRSAFNATAFEDWCKFATVLCGEIRLCLMQHVIGHLAIIANAKLLNFKEMLVELPKEAHTLLETKIRDALGCPTFEIENIEEIVNAMIAASPHADTDPV